MVHYISMILILIALIAPNNQPRHYSGYAPHYGVNVMRNVSKLRNLPIVPCMVSSPYEKIGTWLKVKSLRNDKSLECRVTDVSAKKDRARHVRKKYAVELGWNAAKVLCDLRYVGQRSPKQCPVEVTVLPGR